MKKKAMQIMLAQHEARIGQLLDEHLLKIDTLLEKHHKKTRQYINDVISIQYKGKK